MYFPDDVWKAHILPLVLLPHEEFILQRKFIHFKAEYHTEPEFSHYWKVFPTEDACVQAHQREAQKWPEWVGGITRCCPGNHNWGFLVGCMPCWIPDDMKSAVRCEEQQVYRGVAAEELEPLERRVASMVFAEDLICRLPDLLQGQYGSVCFSPVVVREWYVATLNDCNNLL